jgi:hypothetical protein
VVGPKGNVEFLAWLGVGNGEEIKNLIDMILDM